MSFLYKQAAKIVEEVVEKGKSWKSSAFNPESPSHVKAFALSSQTLKGLSIIEKIVADCKMADDLSKVNKYIAYVMIYDLLFGKNKVDSGGTVKRVIMAYKEQMLATVEEMRKSEHAATIADLLPKKDTCNLFLFFNNRSKFTQVREIEFESCYQRGNV
jgi:hypothetical protein